MKINTELELIVIKDCYPGIIFQLGDEVEIIDYAQLERIKYNELLLYVGKEEKNFIVDYSDRGLWFGINDYIENLSTDYELKGIIYRQFTGKLNQTKHILLLTPAPEQVELLIGLYQKEYNRTQKKLTEELETK